jgi:hypothetical protein
MEPRAPDQREQVAPPCPAWEGRKARRRNERIDLLILNQRSKAPVSSASTGCRPSKPSRHTPAHCSRTCGATRHCRSSCTTFSASIPAMVIACACPSRWLPVGIAPDERGAVQHCGDGVDLEAELVAHPQPGRDTIEEQRSTRLVAVQPLNRGLRRPLGRVHRGASTAELGLAPALLRRERAVRGQAHERCGGRH